MKALGLESQDSFLMSFLHFLFFFYTHVSVSHQQFSVSCVSEDHANELVKAIIKMENLVSLSLQAEGTFFEIEEIFRAVTA